MIHATLHRIVAVAFLAAGFCPPALAQQRSEPLEERGNPIAFVNVNLVAMDLDRVETTRTVLVSGDRIVRVGAASEVVLPEGTRVIDGEGRYLAPGLIDAHVHLEGDGTGARGSRENFGDGPLYLAHGVTTVFNLRGLPVHLDWKRKIENGELLGPTIYTSGEFVNEPRVVTPKDVRREVEAQAGDGYDLIKFHEIWTPGEGWTTTTGLSRQAYVELNEAARSVGLPLIGHAPVNLGVDAMLEMRQSLAHVGTLSNIYFLPLATSRGWLLVTGAALAALSLSLAVRGAIALIRRMSARKFAHPALPRTRVDALAGLVLLAGGLALACAAFFLPGGPMFASVTLRIVFTSLVLIAAAGAVALSLATVGLWRRSDQSTATRLHAGILLIASIAFVFAGLAFWVPLAWRSTDGAIERLARRLHDADILVQTTLVNYEVMGPGRADIVQDPAVHYLSPDVQARWRRGTQAMGAGNHYAEFMKKVTGALHRAGVPLMAGTDAMGVPLMVPGASLHHELRLLVESGLTPYEALRAATATPARFLGRQDEFGTIAVGQRADLLLVSGNPLEDLAHLRAPLGVMVRGKWLTRDELQHMLAALRSD
ncbi:amidohydrolase family protein [Luteimonas sp. R10]|uniref:amidohydrolase family protein n=1 Tax=Luteimonas sp. R10 TaxID=3108176 RepID=UPI00308B739C|nr:amidohydrolase family protein [Luteimonas sp. R10]